MLTVAMPTVEALKIPVTAVAALLQQLLRRQLSTATAAAASAALMSGHGQKCSAA
jgi:hypothetical protein